MTTNEFQFVVFLLFLVQLLATRSLNEGTRGFRFRRGIWRVEVACIALVFAGLVVGQLWLVKIVMPAGVALFVLRAVVRCYDLGVARFAKTGCSCVRAVVVNMCAGVVKVAPGLGAFIMVFLEALPEALLEAAESKPESNSDPFSIGGSDPVGVNEWDYSKTDWEW